jgi:hypothetical protein
MPVIGFRRSRSPRQRYVPAPKEISRAKQLSAWDLMGIEWNDQGPLGTGFLSTVLSSCTQVTISV